MESSANPAKEPASRFIESTAGEVAAELARRGVAADKHVTILIEPDDWLAEARRFSRAQVMAAGLSDQEYRPPYQDGAAESRTAPA